MRAELDSVRAEIRRLKEEPLWIPGVEPSEPKDTSWLTVGTVHYTLEQIKSGAVDGKIDPATKEVMPCNAFKSNFLCHACLTDAKKRHNV